MENRIRRKRRRGRNSLILNESLNDSGIGRDYDEPVMPPPYNPPPEHVQDDQENAMEENEIERKKYIKRLSKANLPDELKRLVCIICMEDDFKSFDSLVRHLTVNI